MECDYTHRKMTSAHAETDHLNVELGLENANKVQNKMVKRYVNYVNTEIYTFIH